MQSDLIFPTLMFKQLDDFLATKTTTDIDRTKYIMFEFKDPANRLNTCLVFDCNMTDYKDPTVIECEYTGAVIHVPAFWIEVPKELAITYLYNILYEVYQGTYRQWLISGYIGNTDYTNNFGISCKCPCGPGAGWIPIN